MSTLRLLAGRPLRVRLFALARDSVFGAARALLWSLALLFSLAPARLLAAQPYESRAAVGGLHSLFIKPDGTLWAMGNNGDGQLGDGTNINRPSVVRSAGAYLRVFSGYGHSFFLAPPGRRHRAPRRRRLGHRAPPRRPPARHPAPLPSPPSRRFALIRRPPSVPSLKSAK